LKEPFKIPQALPLSKSDEKGKEKIVEGKQGKSSVMGCSLDQTRCKVKWLAPEQGWIKLNTDASFCPNSTVASAGIVAQDDGGKVLLTAWRMLQNCGSPEVAEAEACLQGLRLIAEQIGKPTYVESDCANPINDLAKKEENRSAWAGVLQEIQAASHLLPACRFSRVCREANEVAHTLAQWALRQQHCVVMPLNAPPCVHVILDRESQGWKNPLVSCNPDCFR
jgi:hypothetical protein